MSLIGNIYHKNCGGEVHDHQCQRCKKKWGLLHYTITLEFTRNRLSANKERTKVKGQPKLSYTEKYSRGVEIAKYHPLLRMLPNWPRWLKILVTISVIVLVVLFLKFF